MAEAATKKRPAYEVICDEIKSLSKERSKISIINDFDLTTNEGFHDALNKRLHIFKVETQIETLLDVLGKMKIPADGLNYIISQLEGQLGREEETIRINQILDQQYDRHFKENSVTDDPNLNEQ